MILREREFQYIHFAGTVWLVMAVVYAIMYFGIKPFSGFSVIAGIGGSSVAAGTVAFALFVFAVFRSFAQNSETRDEHPFTFSPHYLLMYVSVPFLGGFAGLFAGIGVSSVSNYLLVISMGTLWLTCLVWVVVDPLLGLVEMMLPSSILRKQKRLAQKRREKMASLKAQKRMLKNIELENKELLERWQEPLSQWSSQLKLLSDDNSHTRDLKVIEIGLAAWQLGGLGCMETLHSMISNDDDKAGKQLKKIISKCWDGVGGWRYFHDMPLLA